MRYYALPALCVLSVLVLWLWPGLPNAEAWGDTPTMTDLLMCTFTILGIVVWEIRDVKKRIEYIVKHPNGTHYQSDECQCEKNDG